MPSGFAVYPPWVPLSPIPAPLPVWVRFILIWGPPVAAYLYDKYLVGHESTTDALAWRRVNLIYTRTTPTGTEEDKAQIGFDLINITGGAVDDTWTTGDFTTVETALTAWATSLQSSMQSNHTLTEYRWYRRAFNSLDFEKPFAPSGAPVRITSVSKSGTAGSFLPYQVACSVTEETGLRKHWGRFYVPGIVGTGGIGSTGRYASGTVDAIANATKTLYEACAAAELYMIVPVTQMDKSPVRVLLPVEKVHVDDIPDIQRRRRARTVAYRKTLP